MFFSDQTNATINDKWAEYRVSFYKNFRILRLSPLGRREQTCESGVDMTPNEELTPNCAALGKRNRNERVRAIAKLDFFLTRFRSHEAHSVSL